MNGQESQKPMPKKSCMVTIMFPVADDTDAIAIKKSIDNAIEELKEKRYTFQINET